jgi:hypothetical protein
LAAVLTLSALAQHNPEKVLSEGVQDLAFTIPVISDFIVVIVLRKLFGSLSHVLSITRISIYTLILFGLIIAMGMLPFWLRAAAGLIHLSDPSMNKQLLSSVEDTKDLLFGMNAATMLFCLLPLGVLLFILLHRLIWPTLSRLIWPIVSNGWIKNKKLLVGLGSLCLLYAITAKRFGLEDLLKLLPGS